MLTTMLNLRPETFLVMMILLWKIKMHSTIFVLNVGMNSKYPLCIEQSSGSITYFATFRSLCHSFVLDPNDKIYVNEEVFTDFRVFDIRELRKAIFKSQQ
ncbi:uncharacterized protein OCT59_006518 [Rhizophagus irregularis]|uniref:uncharacterized protein n=1 Tax=Rhizophagus irregularis TaxID=588596 RepID=UPI0033313ADD|nr:hypothetical protein OCT59_006518 [Rhizophagus irregularis]